jgi:hypothetical protein
MITVFWTTVVRLGNIFHADEKSLSSHFRQTVWSPPFYSQLLKCKEERLQREKKEEKKTWVQE